MGELHDLTAVEQAAAIRAGSVSPVELTEHYLARIDRLDATLGAFITTTPDIARKQAGQAETVALAARREDRGLPALYGVPVPVKDLNFVAGVRCTLGSAAYADHVPDTDDHVVTRLRDAGTILLGKTNTPEFGLPCYTENRLAPPARTPWDLTRSAGGSSGGAAAAVAGGLAPIAQGSDGGGSIRIPASVCGLFGIKPSRGRVSAGPVQHDVSGLSASGPIARTVADAAALLDVLAGPMPGDPYAAPSLPPGETFSCYATREPGRLRVVALPDPPVPGVSLHPDCRTAFDSAAELLRELGHEVDELALPVDDSIKSAFEAVWAVMATVYPVAPADEASLMPLTRGLRTAGGQITGPAFAAALYGFRALGQLVADALLSSYDVILTPTLAQPPAPIGGLRHDEDPAAEFEGLAHFTPFTPLYNATGQPAVNVPLHWTEQGLPIGVMLGGRYGDEATLISLSAQLEQARPWAGRRPEVWA
ncbi:amidase [Streptomyces sp. DvalAA-14]|uniref:amidase n=1 Tax=unclassified Streptomyces TaxID=2593676 RepID=UPI00081B4AA8|nr:MULTISPECIES: amidase [unclassified Streptomyces]MYS21955.1 amidase [Streptomyces sp. SID4948]SCE05190.1 amidase [Streptomyces sp. DvalAA-14]